MYVSNTCVGRLGPAQEQRERPGRPTKASEFVKAIHGCLPPSLARGDRILLVSVSYAILSICFFFTIKLGIKRPNAIVIHRMN